MIFFIFAVVNGDSSLTCSEGFSFKSQIISIGSWNVTRCRGDMGQKCLRGEGVVIYAAVQSNYVAFSFSRIFCVLLLLFTTVGRLDNDKIEHLLSE